MHDRGIRRQAERNKKENVKRLMREVWGGKQYLNPRLIGKIATTPHSCDSPCCTNPRKCYKGENRLTIQERKSLPTE